jgi:peptidoglycan/xylan/chitin deacetylase (PgdA/CDA1 family)
VQIPILTYHSIDSSGSIISTDPEIFRAQMKILVDENYNVQPLSKIVESLKNKEKIAPKTIALTFDDGFKNFYYRAFPVLSAYGFPATVFLVTDYCGRYNDWRGNPLKFPRTRLLSWAEIKFLAMNNIEFGAHTRTHPDLTKIPITAAEREILQSKSIIEGKIGKKVQTFAYPFGKFNQCTKQIVAEHFEAAVSVNLNKAGADSDLYTLERIDAYYLSDTRIFSALDSLLGDFYLMIRRSLRRLKGWL